MAAVAACAIVVASCGSDDDAAPAAPSESNAAEPTDADGDAPADSAAPGETEPESPADFDETAILKFGFSSPLQTIDPHRAGPAQVVYVNPVFEPLIEFTADGELVPRLATEWELGDDAMTLDLKLREGVSFTDGTPFNAEAVKINIDRARSDETNTAAAMLVDIDDVEVLDEYSVRFHLNTAGGRIPSVLAERSGYMISPAAIATGDIDANPIGTGPFVLDSVGDALVTYTANPDYWDAENVHLAGYEVHVMGDDSARLNSVRSGQTHITHIRPQQQAEADAAGVGTVSGPSVSQYGIMLNPSVEAFAVPEVRKAISYAIDRESINEALFANGCTANSQAFPANGWAHSDDVDATGWGEFDPEYAKQLLADGGYPDGFDFVLTTYSVTSYQRMAEAVQAQLAAIGVNATIEVGDAAALHPEWRGNNLESWLAVYYPARPDPTVFISDYFVESGIYNPGGFTVDGLAELSTQSLESVDEAERAVPMNELLVELYDAGAPVVSICDPVSTSAFAEGVDGVTAPMWGNYDFRHVTIAN